MRLVSLVIGGVSVLNWRECLFLQFSSQLFRITFSLGKFSRTADKSQGRSKHTDTYTYQFL